MFATVEFPFVASLPKREKSKLARLWEQFRELHELGKTEGVLVPPRAAAKLLGLSQQRVDQLMDTGKLRRIEFCGHPYIPEASLLLFAQSVRRTGRPVTSRDVASACFSSNTEALVKALKS